MCVYKAEKLLDVVAHPWRPQVTEKLASLECTVQRWPRIRLTVQASNVHKGQETMSKIEHLRNCTASSHVPFAASCSCANVVCTCVTMFGSGSVQPVSEVSVLEPAQMVDVYIYGSRERHLRIHILVCVFTFTIARSCSRLRIHVLVCVFAFTCAFTFALTRSVPCHSTWARAELGLPALHGRSWIRLC